MAINNGIGRVWAANAGEEGRPAGVGPVWIENIDAITPSGSGGSTYTGGRGIDVDNVNHEISLDEDTQAAINSYVINSGSFLTSGDLNGYATETFVTNEISEATSAFITSSDLDGYATETWVQNQGYITSIPSEYVTDTEMSNYVTEQTSAFLTSADIPEVPVIGFENEGVLDTDYDGIKIVNDSVGNEHVNLKKGDSWYNHGLLVPTSPGSNKYLTTTSAGKEAWENIPEIPEVPGVKDLIAGNGIDITSTSADVTISVDNTVLTSADLNGYATEQYVNSATNDMATQTWVGQQGYLTSIPAEYVTSAQLADTSAAIENDIPDVTDMATQTWVGQQGYLTSIPAEYVTSAQLSATSAAIENDMPDTTDMATQTWTSSNFFPIDGLQVVSSSAEASGANIIYIVSGSNA